LREQLDDLSARFKVSSLVALLRLHDTGALSTADYWPAYEQETDRVLQILGQRGTGGNYFNTQASRVSRRFARALIASTLEGQTLHRDAFQMLGIRRQATFDQLAARLVIR
jgi:Zn-dependent peptidase ImmA (M78 family)